MAHVLFCTFGSRGDLHPAIAIALALGRHGVRSTIATGEEHRATVERAGGVGFAAVPPARAVFEQTPGMMARIMDERSGGEVIFREIVLPYIEQTHAATLEAAGDADVIVGHPLALTAPTIAEQLRVPYVYTALQPLCFFSAIDPPVLAPAPWAHALRHLGPWAIRALYSLMRLQIRSWGEPIQQLRERLGLPRSRESSVIRGLYSQTLNLGLFSPLLAAPQADWPANTVAVGPCLFDDPGAWSDRDRVTAFLSPGDAPLVVTLGSSAVEIGERIFDAAARAARAMGRRCLLLTGPLPAPAACDGERVIAAAYAPFSQVFPHAAAVLHQCGAGTTAEAMRAGVPQVCVPFGHDQPDHAARLEGLGIAVKLGRKSITAAQIQEAFERVLDARRYYGRRAGAVGERSRAENGAERAVVEILKACERGSAR
ncbi:MAG: glycosyltransferase [Phycisphaerales bacterium]